MGALGSYVLSLTGIALICGTLLLLPGSGTTKEVIRLVCGVLLAVTALSPLKSLELPAFEEFWQEPAAAGAEQSRQGREMAEQAILQSITHRLEAYILDKAKELGEHITCSLQLGQDRYPRSVTLYGSPSPENREILSRWITDVLGIAKENQQWIG